MKNLPNRLKRLRECYKFTVLEAEWVCGISRSALNTWERGTRMPSADGLYQIATAYGVSMDWLCGIISSPYTLESLETAESIHISKSLFDDASELDLPFDEKEIFLSDTFIHYIDDKQGFCLEARANILVYVLFIFGLQSYLVKHPGIKLTPPQLYHRKFIASELMKVLRTKEPFASPH